jgi:MFS transporter, CP family, cyanate transporter
VNRQALVVLAAGVCAALHASKLPPAVPVLQQAMGLTLVQAGFLLSLVQGAGMAVGVAVGALAEGFGLKRSLVTGLGVLTVASALGGLVATPAALMVLRALEGFGFLLCVLAAPALLRRLVDLSNLPRVMGWWGSYMPLGTALALLLGPLVMAELGWHAWWWLLAAVTAVMALLVHRLVDPALGGNALGELDATRAVPMATPAASAPSAWQQWRSRLVRTLRVPGPWWVGMTFALYSSQWLAVVGFLPTLTTALGYGPSAVAVLTALVAIVNLFGNVWGGRRLARGASARRQLWVGFGAMALAAWVAFAGLPSSQALSNTESQTLRFVALLVFSWLGGFVPSTLFVLATRVAPDADTVASTVGWVQQWSALGQFAGPPAAAWLAQRVGGWSWTWALTGGMALGGAVLAAAAARAARASPAPAAKVEGL